MPLLGDEKFLTVDDAGAWDGPTVVVAWTCLCASFTHPKQAGLSEAWLRDPQGTVAFVGPTGETTTGDQSAMALAFHRALADGATLGDALLAGWRRVRVEGCGNQLPSVGRSGPASGSGTLSRDSVQPMQRRNKWIVPLFGGLCVAGGLALMVLGLPPKPAPPSSPTALPPVTPVAIFMATMTSEPPTPTPEPIVPTRTPRPSATPPLTATATFAPPSPTFTKMPTATPGTVEASASTVTSTPASVPEGTATVAPTPLPVPSSVSTPLPSPTTAPVSSGFVVPAHERFRIGVSLPYGAGRSYNLGALGVGWVMDWSVRTSTALPAGVDYFQTVRMMGGVLRPDAATLTAVAAARPGATWLISNEADVRWQDNVDPATYARLYHEAYTAIKAGNGSAVVAAGGISQPTPLRLRYLDLVLEAYRNAYGQALPAQAWHIHNYMLHEERDSWGVDIPPGIADNTGVLYGVDDSGNLDAFRAQIWDFRRWMASRGYGGLPLHISEFGVPMPPDYGFPPERMAVFLRETWSFFLTAADGGLGDPNDGGRLVQRWCWFSMGVEQYPTGNLIDSAGNWTSLAWTWISYVRD